MNCHFTSAPHLAEWCLWASMIPPSWFLCDTALVSLDALLSALQTPNVRPMVCRAGRVGTAFSLLTRDEMPYLLDLHLFLARPLWPAPVQSIAAAAGAAAAADPETSVYGSFPLVSLESAGEHVRELLAHSSDLQAQLRYATNASKLYRKTRPAPSPESVRRAKGLPAEGIHPTLAGSVPSTAFGAHRITFLMLWNSTAWQLA